MEGMKCAGARQAYYVKQGLAHQYPGHWHCEHLWSIGIEKGYSQG